MALHFSPAEFARRKESLLAAMEREKLDGLLLFQQESMYWLTGYDTFGFCFFQSLLVTAGGDIVLLTRSADLRQAELTSNIEDIRIWRDGRDADPAGELGAIAAEKGLAGKRIGVEYESYGLVAANGRRLDAAFDGLAQLTDASLVVTRLRAVKSQEELAYVRRAAVLADEADRAAIALTRAGADEGEILAAQHAAIFRGGGDYPANEFIIGSGREALLCRYKSGRRVLDPRDQLTLEFAGVYRHYHVAAMRTLVIGDPRPEHLTYHRAAQEALLACEAAMRPGKTAGDVFTAHAKALDAAGLAGHRLNACGYSLGAKFTPSWMDWPMFYEDNDWPLVPGMVMFAHMILMDSQSGTAMCLGRTYLVTEGAPDALNLPSLDLVLC
ncbi:aminopeptidase P family protein [Chelatococcus daeguensis]|uniref:Xaa-Pro dipeptidase n=1 Tax=Chelatococcus daeguensis TaxID=444444 RepID=A0AAC9NZP8_9HYPH|nr:Xaa-Pro peptidase family protein [Chelatococcus daeguensis]APF38255.1 Xaa-Pro dipeptidase [Chelatococcus daeguensis]KZE27523.1 Xaa-Pro dipeptidase [Chelatococcus daeguensis]MBM3085752.1 aminopeptidase P family protein [Chelatococcus daeguensis]